MLVTFKSGLQMFANRIELCHGMSDDNVRIYFTSVSDIVSTPNLEKEGTVVRAYISNCFSDDGQLEMHYQVHRNEIDDITHYSCKEPLHNHHDGCPTCDDGPCTGSTLTCPDLMPNGGKAPYEGGE